MNKPSAFVLMLVALAATGAPAGAQTKLTLADAIARAREDTAGARALAAAVDEADARIRRASSGYWPRVDLAETVQRGNQPVFVFSSLLAQRRFSAASFAVDALNHPDPVTNTRTAIGIEQTVFDAGMTRLGVQAATLDRDMAAATSDAVRQDLAFQAAQAFVAVLQHEAAVGAADAAVAAAESDRQRASARRDAGLVTDADVLAVEVHLADVRQMQIAAVGDLAVARLQLADAVGLPPATPIAPIAPVPPPDPDDSDALVQEALANHPALGQADLQLQLADNRRRSARAALWPAVGAQGGWELNGATFGSQRSSWAIGAEVRMNLFRGGADAATMAEARHAYLRAAAERERAARRIEVEVRGALTQLAAARARAQAGQAALTQARESQRIVRDRYENGVAGVTDLLRAAGAVVDAESRATAADMDVILRGVALDRARGRL
ncbi:MAG: TolC family protein [Acidobacteria bacterium]|nr:TolC family protein [Acidobacteriota bacterium]